MKKVFACLFFLLSLPAFASDLLTKIQQTLINAPLLRGEFIQQKNLQGVSKTLSSQGYFIVDKEQTRLLWVTTKPFQHILRITKEGIVQKTADGRVLMQLEGRSEATVSQISQILFALFAGNSQTFNQFFTDKGQIEAGQWHLQLTPTHPAIAKVLRQISLDGAQSVQNIKLEMKTGDTTRIAFTKVAPLTTLSADEIAAFK